MKKKKEKIMIDLKHIRQDFPILQTKVNNKSLVYLDNAATTQKPKTVIDAITEYYTTYNANVHRGIHHLSQRATEAQENSRETIRNFIGARHQHEVIFTKGTTESINLVAYSIKKHIQKHDEIIISALEHHANIVPWQRLCQERGSILKVIPLKADLSLDLTAFENMLSKQTKIVSVNYVSNALGIINPVKEIIDKAHSVGAWVLIDGAQSAPHFKVDVQALDADFYAFSAHKLYGPTGIGVLYGKEALLNQMEPYQSGGEMVDEVYFEKTTFAELPFKFEAGTPHIEGAIVLGKAIDYITQIGVNHINTYENKLLSYADQSLKKIPNLKLYGDKVPRAGVASFNIEGLHPFDVGSILDQLGIAIRTGNHCAQPVVRALGVSSTLRASFAFYNTFDEIDALVEGLQTAQRMLK